MMEATQVGLPPPFLALNWAFGCGGSGQEASEKRPAP
jgi:hypothetical protein